MTLREWFEAQKYAILKVLNQEGMVAIKFLWVDVVPYGAKIWTADQGYRYHIINEGSKNEQLLITLY